MLKGFKELFGNRSISTRDADIHTLGETFAPEELMETPFYESASDDEENKTASEQQGWMRRLSHRIGLGGSAYTEKDLLVSDGEGV